MTGNEIRSKFLDFFKAREHAIIPSASLVPENDPSVLFNTAGMQPLVPYLMGQPHPTGAKRIADSQKCVRTNDIDEVGDNTHLTFFEMLGNWSLGDYFKQEAITWSYEFLTSKEEGLGLDPKRLYVTVFEGDENAPRDEEAHRIWKEIFERAGLDPERRIFFMDADSNWWSPGDNGPCGPDSEMFYDVTGTLTEGLSKEEFLAADDRQDVVEIWNDVFMEYEKKDGKVVGKLAAQNVDTGSGLERVTAVVQGKQSVFDTDLFLPLLDAIKNASSQSVPESERIIADHLRAAVFLIGDGVTPSNTDQGYVLRRLLRRAIRHARKLKIVSILPVAHAVIEHYHAAYPVLAQNREQIEQEISKEETNFSVTLDKGLRIIRKKMDNLWLPKKDFNGTNIPNRAKEMGELMFELFTVYGFPKELTLEEMGKAGVFRVIEDGLGDSLTEKTLAEFEKRMTEHQAKSRAGAEQKFKGGLADHSEKVVQYHTTTHLLLAALRKELGDHVHQAGSNITGERLRFDFTHPEKIERETLDRIEAMVNESIAGGGTVTIETMDKSAAETDPTIEGSFWDRYPDKVNVYTITATGGTVLSRELCGGPHVTDLAEIKGTFRITKEESSSAGVRRIKAVLA